MNDKRNHTFTPVHVHVPGSLKFDDKICVCRGWTVGTHSVFESKEGFRNKKQYASPQQFLAFINDNTPCGVHTLNY
jgi:hypothetical protein